MHQRRSNSRSRLRLSDSYYDRRASSLAHALAALFPLVLLLLCRVDGCDPAVLELGNPSRQLFVPVWMSRGCIVVPVWVSHCSCIFSFKFFNV